MASNACTDLRSSSGIPEALNGLTWEQHFSKYLKWDSVLYAIE